MFDRFTDRARNVIALAQEEARELGHDHIGTEHLLLGLLRGEGVANGVLESFGFTVDRVRAQIRDRMPRSDAPPGAQIPFTPGAKKVLELSLRESIRMGQDHLGTEHILLGLVREDEGVAAEILGAAGADERSIRTAVTAIVPRARGRAPLWRRRPLGPFQLLAAARDEALENGNYDLARKLLELEIEQRERRAGPADEPESAGGAV